MYTILQFLSIILFITWIICLLVWLGKALFAWIDHDDEKALSLVTNWKLWILAVSTFFLLWFMSMVSSRYLDELECEASNGVWETKDSGMIWNCYNPDLITTENNSRIILEQD